MHLSGRILDITDPTSYDFIARNSRVLEADAKSTPSYSSDQHFLWLFRKDASGVLGVFCFIHGIHHMPQAGFHPP